MTTIHLDDPFGVEHRFTMFGPELQLPALPGIYFVARFDVVRRHYEVLYIGKCENFRARHSCHHKRLDFLLQGATHIGWHYEPNESLRTQLEADLIHRYQPPLNNVPTLARLMGL